MAKAFIVKDDYTQEELLKMPYKEAIDGINEKAQRFCEYYIEGHNKKMALLKAGYGDYNSSSFFGTRLLNDPKIKRYMQWLKVRIINKHMLSGYELIDQWIRIAFSDMSDFVEIHPNHIRLKPEEQIDGQLIKSIRSGRDGISIELHDKMKALDQLAKYCSDMPKEWKQMIEERKIDIAEQEFELKKKMVEMETPQQEDDEFMEAIKKSAQIIWEEKENS